MRNLLALLAFVVIAFAVIGWYLDWYQVTTGRSGDSFRISFDRSKIRSDVNHVQEGIENTKQRLAEKPSTVDKTADKIRDKADKFRDKVEDVLNDPSTIAGSPK